MDKNPEQQVSELLTNLHPDLYSVLCEKRQTAGSLLEFKGWDKRRLRRLEKHAGLDALASLVLLLRLAAKAEQHKQAFEFGSAVCRVLLMMGAGLVAHGIARPLAEYITEYVLVLANHDGQHPCFGQEGFIYAARSLARTARVVEGNENKRLTPREKSGLMLDLLDDKFNVPFSGLVATRQFRSPTDKAELNNSSQLTR